MGIMASATQALSLIHIYKEYLLIGGNDHKTANGGYHYENLISFVNNYYPNAKIEYMWANQDCITVSYTHLDVYKRQELLHCVRF